MHAKLRYNIHTCKILTVVPQIMWIIRQSVFFLMWYLAKLPFVTLCVVVLISSFFEEITV